MPTSEEHRRELQNWAAGDNAREAATDLLLHEFDGRFAAADKPWIQCGAHGPWVDFASIPAAAGSYASGGQSFLRLVASLGSPDVNINLYRDFFGLDRKLQRAVADSLRAAAGPAVHATVWGPAYPQN